MSVGGSQGGIDSLPRIVSVDDHVLEPPSLWQTRLATKDLERAPHVIEDTCKTIWDGSQRGIPAPQYIKGGDGPVTDWWVYEDLVFPIGQPFAAAGFPTDLYSNIPIRFADMRPGCYETQARLADMDLNHTERSMCFPSMVRFCGQLFLEGKDKELALRCVRAYNDWMVEEWSGPSGGRLIPICLIPLWDSALAAAEVRRNAARGCRAVAFCELPSRLGIPSIHSGWWDSFFEACDETGTVICMHIGSSSKMAETSPDAPAGVRHGLVQMNSELALADWLMSGVLARFENLKIALSEGQAGWIPYLLDRLDFVYRHEYALAQLDPAITQPPSAYVPGRVYACIFNDPVAIELRERIGVGQLTFETDYPHQGGTWPDSLRVLEELAAEVSEKELEMIARTNALEMLGLDTSVVL